MKNKLEITINGIEWNNEFTVKFNNETAKISATKDTCIFYFDEPKQYELTIIQESRKLHIWEKIFCYLFALVQGIFYIILFHSDERWYESISAYSLKNSMVVDLQADTRLLFTIKHGNVEVYPVLECNRTDKIINEALEYYPNITELKLGFFHHFRKLSALFVYLYVLMIIIGAKAYTIGNTGLAIFSLIVIIAFVILHICIYVKDKRRIEGLRSKFMEL